MQSAFEFDGRRLSISGAADSRWFICGSGWVSSESSARITFDIAQPHTFHLRAALFSSCLGDCESAAFRQVLLLGPSGIVVNVAGKVEPPELSDNIVVSAVGELEDGQHVMLSIANAGHLNEDDKDTEGDFWYELTISENPDEILDEDSDGIPSTETTQEARSTTSVPVATP